MSLLLASLLAGCAPLIDKQAAPTMQDLLVARATVDNRTLTFEIKNISQKPLEVDWSQTSAECDPDPEWEIRTLDGSVTKPTLPFPPSGTRIPPDGIITCMGVGIAAFLAPGDRTELKRTLYLPPGTYSIKAWLRSPLEPQYGRLEAPTITVTIP